MIVAIDAGNTCCKWGVFDASGVLVRQGTIDTAQVTALAHAGQDWLGCRRVVLSNVAGAAVGRQLQAVCDQLGLPLMTIVATPSACGVTNGYLPPALLGVDRWAALVAAWNRYREPCVVATAGTALTVDALSSQGEFLGGLIVPGRRMMQSALAAGTAGLGEPAGVLQHFPVNTGDAICSGAWLAMAGAVERMCHALQAREGRAPRCVLSGGDAAGLQVVLPSPAEIADNLVLHGLWLIERARA